MGKVRGYLHTIEVGMEVLASFRIALVVRVI